MKFTVLPAEGMKCALYNTLHSSYTLQAKGQAIRKAINRKCHQDFNKIQIQKKTVNETREF
jgi:hypothetical protein